MLCEKCQQREATVFVTQVLFGHRSRRHLCQQCAAPLLDTLPPPRSAEPVLPLSIPPDPQRPSVLHLPESITVRDLARALRIQPFHVISLLMDDDIFATVTQRIDFRS